jgi:hypothetical protein
MDSTAAFWFPLTFRPAFMRAALLLLSLAPAPLAAVGVEPEVTGSVSRPGLLSGRVRATAVFEPALGATTLNASVGPSSCLLLRFPGQWQLLPAAEGVLIGDLGSDAQVSLSFHDAAEFRLVPGASLATNYAAQLEHEYQGLFGRPVTVATFEPVAAGVYRWRATWSDGNWDNAARALNLERFFVEALPDKVIELALEGSVDGHADTIVPWLTSTLEARKANCRPH